MTPIFNRLPVLSLGRWWAGNDIRVHKSGLYVEDGLVYGEPKACKINYAITIMQHSLTQSPPFVWSTLVVLMCSNILSSVDFFSAPIILIYLSCHPVQRLVPYRSIISFLNFFLSLFLHPWMVTICKALKKIMVKDYWIYSSSCLYCSLLQCGWYVLSLNILILYNFIWGW